MRGEILAFYISVFLLAFYSSTQLQISAIKSITLFAILLAVATLTFLAMRKAKSIPPAVRARVAAFLYLFGFFWFVLSITVLILVAILFESTRPEMKSLLAVTGLSGIVMLTVSGSILLAAWRIWSLPTTLRK